MRSTLDTLAFDTEAVTIVGEHDFAVRAHLIAPRGGRARPRSRRSSPTPSRSPSAPASCASSCPGSNGAASAAPPRRCGWSASRSGPGRRSAPASAAELYGCDDPPRGDRGRGRQRHPLRLDRAGRDRARRARALEDLARLLRARRGPPGRAGRRAAGVLQPRGQPEPGSSRGPCARASAATCSSATSRGLERTAVAEAIEALRDQGRVGADPGLLPGRLNGRVPPVKGCPGATPA